MATRFLFKTRKTLPGLTVQLRHKGLWLSDGDTSKITGQIVRAKGVLSTTLAAIHGSRGELNGLAARYFLTPASGPSAAQWGQIETVLRLTYQGIGNDVTLKLGADGDAGFVARTEMPVGTAGAAVDPVTGENWVFDGTIHLSKRLLLQDRDQGTITFLHEATHKFANTWDHDNAGYRLPDDSGWAAPGLTVAQALNNADSYAFFAFRAGAARGW